MLERCHQLIEVATNLWIGNSDEEGMIVHHRPMMDAVLITAHDMVPTNDWKDKIEYMHVGLVDGPGNPLAAYHAAVLALVALVKRGEGQKVLICDHDGGRSLAVVIMYLYLLGEGPSWDEAVDRMMDAEEEQPKPHDARCEALERLGHKDNAHRKAFFLMDWGMMSHVLSAEV